MSVPYVPSPWDAYGPPQPRDVDLPPDELDETWECEAHDGDHHTRRDCRAALEKELPSAESDVSFAQQDLDDAEARLEEIRDALLDLTKWAGHSEDSRGSVAP